MIGWTEAIIAGIVQGVTEFVPVSSSGHLVFVHSFFGFKSDNLFFNLYLHMATLLAVFVYFRREILSLFTERRSWIKFIVLASIPAAVVGFLFKRNIAPVFHSPRMVSAMLFVSAFFLLSAESGFRIFRNNAKGINTNNAILIGFAQALALFPGVSRSGTTISTGLFSGIDKKEVFLFSFLMSIPVIMGGFLLKVLTCETSAALSDNMGPYILGSVAAFFAALVSLRFLWFMIKKSKLYVFGLYCLAAGTMGLIFL